MTAAQPLYVAAELADAPVSAHVPAALLPQHSACRSEAGTNWRQALSARYLSQKRFHRGKGTAPGVCGMQQATAVRRQWPRPPMHRSRAIKHFCQANQLQPVIRLGNIIIYASFCVNSLSTAPIPVWMVAAYSVPNLIASLSAQAVVSVSSGCAGGLPRSGGGGQGPAGLKVPRSTGAWLPMTTISTIRKPMVITICAPPPTLLRNAFAPHAGATGAEPNGSHAGSGRHA